MQSGNLNFLESSGPIQACNGTALPLLSMTYIIIGDRGSTVVKVLCYKSEGRWFDPKCFHEIFHWHKSFWSHYGPGIDSASNRNEYWGVFPGGKCGRCVRLTTLPPSCAVVKKSGNPNFLEPSGLVQDRNGTALPLYIIIIINNYEKNSWSNFANKIRTTGSY
jgi:hypothetical protein